MAFHQSENSESLCGGAAFARPDYDRAKRRGEGVTHNPASARMLHLDRGLDALVDESRTAAMDGGLDGVQVGVVDERGGKALVGERVAVFYRLHLQEHRGWFTVEQQAYCTVVNAAERVEKR